MLLLIASAPFVAPSLSGLRWPGLDVEQATMAVASIAACLALVATIAYLLSSCGSPSEVAGGFAISAPFLLEGLHLLSEKGRWEFASRWLPVGLPYSVETYHDESLIAAAILASSVVALRLFVMCHTRWLRPAESTRRIVDG